MTRAATPPSCCVGSSGRAGHGDSDLLLAAINPHGDEDDPIYSCVTRLLLEHQRHEEGRLLYVAATRARRRLHLVTQVKLKESNTGATVVAPPSKGALLARLWPALQSGIERDVGAAGSGPPSARHATSQVR